MGPLQVKLNLPDQWKTVGICYVQLLHFTYTIFLQKHKENDHINTEFEMKHNMFIDDLTADKDIRIKPEVFGL